MGKPVRLFCVKGHQDNVSFTALASITDLILLRASCSAALRSR